MKVVFTEEARAGLREIALYISRDNQRRALSFVRELRASAQQLSNMPHAFPLFPL